MLLICANCKKEFNAKSYRKFCSRSCSGLFKTKSVKVMKHCEWCGKEFEVLEIPNSKKPRRFCSTSCSAFWRNKTYGPSIMCDESKKMMSERLKNLWKDDEFRQKKIEYMKTNNPVYMYGVVEKAHQTRLKNGSYPNNYKYGNGKISKYESIVKDKLSDLNFYYNYAIATKLARDAYPEEHFPNNYKPDFVNLVDKLCIEIDGHSHDNEYQKKLDVKKEKCLAYLGFKTIRFTHEQIERGEFEEWLNSYQKDK